MTNKRQLPVQKRKRGIERIGNSQYADDMRVAYSNSKQGRLLSSQLAAVGHGEVIIYCDVVEFATTTILKIETEPRKFDSTAARRDDDPGTAYIETISPAGILRRLDDPCGCFQYSSTL